VSHLQPHIRWFKTLGLNDVAQVGGKNASLGEMYQKLTGEGIRTQRVCRYLGRLPLRP
jgi:pyruvate,water dikinase